MVLVSESYALGADVVSGAEKRFFLEDFLGSEV